MPSLRYFGYGLVAAIVAAAAGCGGDPLPVRVGLTGEVRFDGKPLPDGTVSFLPVDRGVAVSAEVKNGTFVLPPGAGPSPGEYKVEVLSFRPTGNRVEGPSADGTGKSAQMKQVIPETYNTRTNLRFTVTDGGPPCQLDLKANP
ncbi:MAG: hypothetical protein ACRC7O_09580 [Fimbriiglobus sp.]